jgi:hypothetical protein
MCRYFFFSMLLINLAFTVLEINSDRLFGKRLNNDKLMLEKVVNEPWKLFRNAHVTKTYAGGDRIGITQIQVIQNTKHQLGATVKVQDGGPKFNYEILDFMDTATSDIHFFIKIYANLL